MTRLLALALLAGCAPALGGCVASMAASAVGMAAESAMPKPKSNEILQPDAASACSAAAAKYGAVHIIDVEQQRISKIVVWGTVDDGKTKRSFQCAYGTKITGLKLSAIKPAS
jgi:Zn-dependent alcohol dehydrogenase